MVEGEHLTSRCASKLENIFRNVRYRNAPHIRCSAAKFLPSKCNCCVGDFNWFSLWYLSLQRKQRHHWWSSLWTASFCYLNVLKSHYQAMRYSTTVHFGGHARYLIRELHFGVLTGNIMTRCLGAGTGRFKFRILIYQTLFLCPQEGVSGSGCISSHLLNHLTEHGRMISFTLRLFTRTSRCSLNRELRGPQSQSEPFTQHKI